MSHGKLREDKHCLNCNNLVEDRFCSKCGQENVEVRQSFHYLFSHFIEDFTHYDSKFWRNLKFLFFKPGHLTNLYLSGKKNTCINPVKFYIFVSFITFFVLAILPSNSDNLHNTIIFESFENKKFIDSLENKVLINKEEFIKLNNNQTKKQEDGYLKEIFINKLVELKDKKITESELSHSFSEKIISYTPKVLFFYLPIFAFILWLLYNKKKWWYFDHGIFTLHYFSFLLLSILFMNVLGKLSSLLNNNFFDGIINFSLFLIFSYNIIYLYIGLKNVYKESNLITFIKGSFILLLNTLLFLTILIFLLLFIFFKL